MINPSEYVFNTDALLFSAVMLFGILLFHASYMFVINRKYSQTAQWLIDKKHYLWAQFSLPVAGFVLVLAHPLEILMLGYLLKWTGLISGTHQAMVFAGSTYTTVGFGTDPLPVEWQLVMVTMALSGLVTIAWTTSVLFGMSSYSHKAYELEVQQKRNTTNN